MTDLARVDFRGKKVRWLREDEINYFKAKKKETTLPSPEEPLYWVSFLKGNNEIGGYFIYKMKLTSKEKLLNKEREALKTLPRKIEEMEAERDRITALMQEPDYYRNAQNDPAADQQKLEKLENEILQSYERWEELEELA